MNGVGLFFLLLLLLVILPAVGWIGFTRWRAHSRGLPAPPLSAYNPFKKSSNPYGSSSGGGGSGGGGPIGWVKDKFATMRDHRAGQGYAGRTRGSRGFGPLDPDAAWDDRVALEADEEYGYDRPGRGPAGPQSAGVGRPSYSGYEEQELGGVSSPRDHGPYGMHGGGGAAAAMPGYGEDRGRSRSREDLTYHGAGSIGQTELDNRYDATVHGGSGGGGAMRGLSPRPAESPSRKQERRSIFREDV